ncbi:hypothetical protein QMK33_11190 [Hymenobacter sp. H14-R3]|uniref:hypothetical protein n=1 Tax=Hymenobacter sp. H14-R3 TaxID=3046308 RepID=UPI0024BACA68|nr:hypothetical protein [Hymenobacter sp. H14-R3]MDJ0365718.1 hypothetical protein [Hymenobacter sp. H14-R3]
MAEQGKDLPLVVAEILIEIHGINDRLESVESHLGNMKNILLQVVDNVQHSSKAINRTAEVTLQQKQAFNRRFNQLDQQQETSRRFDQQQQQGDRIERAIVSFENCLERLENK